MNRVARRPEVPEQLTSSKQSSSLLWLIINGRNGKVFKEIKKLAARDHYRKYSQPDTPMASTQQPKLYIYDFCPFSCRARVALGIKKVKYDVVFMAFDDVATPTSLVGTKASPIFVPVGEKPFSESWDVVSYVNNHYGDGPIINEASGRADLAKWIESAMPSLNMLFNPRLYAAPLPEFTLRASREFFKTKREASMPFSEALAKTPELVEKVNQLLLELESMFYSNHSVNEELSYDDLDLFGRLRALTLIKDIKWPTKVREFMEYISKTGDVPMFDNVVKM